MVTLAALLVPRVQEKAKVRQTEFLGNGDLQQINMMRRICHKVRRGGGVTAVVLLMCLA